METRNVILIGGRVAVSSRITVQGSQYFDFLNTDVGASITLTQEELEIICDLHRARAIPIKDYREE